MNKKLLAILTIICQLAIICIVVFNILSFYSPTSKIFNFFRHTDSFSYLFLFFIYLNLCHFSNNTKKQETVSIGDRMLRIKEMIVNRDKTLFFIFIPILITLININVNYKDREDREHREDNKTDINICLNNNWTIIILAILIVVLNILKRFGISKLISIYNLDYFTLGVFLIFIVQNIFLDDIKTYIVESVFIFYPLIDSFSILSKKPNGGFIDLIKILSEYPIHNMFLTSIPVVSLGAIMLIMKFFKDCTEFTLVIGTVVLSLIALYHLISILYIINRDISEIPYISKYIIKFKNMMIICLNESEQSDDK